MRGEVHILVHCPIDTLQWGSTHSAVVDCAKDWKDHLSLFRSKRTSNDDDRINPWTRPGYISPGNISLEYISSGYIAEGSCLVQSGPVWSSQVWSGREKFYLGAVHILRNTNLGSRDTPHPHCNIVIYREDHTPCNIVINFDNPPYVIS